MSLAESLVLALIQGLTEFIPVSSSGHLVLISSFFGLTGESGLTFILVLHVATVCAAVVFYRKDVLFLLGAFLPPYRRPPIEKSRARRIVLLVALATVPTGLIGVTLSGHLERLFQEPEKVALSLFVTGFVLIAASRLSDGDRTLESFEWWKAVLLGIAQGAAIVPGISRSGMTIAAALALGLRRVEAVKLSFILLLPATVGAALFEGGQVASLGAGDLLQLTGSFLTAAIVGYASIWLVVRWTREGHLWYFGLYCWLVAAAALVGRLD